MRRRAILAAISIGGPAFWSTWANAQPHEPLRRVEVLMGGLSEGDAAGLAELAAFEAELKALGWVRGRNLTIDVRWPGANLESVSEAARAIAASRPPLVLSRAGHRSAAQ